MLVFKKGSYKVEHMTLLLDILQEGSKHVLECDTVCTNCPHRKVCIDIEQLETYLSKLIDREKSADS